ncbi:MAG: hypothetical protein RR048_03140 [Oscillospiraceae bacterium]
MENIFKTVINGILALMISVGIIFSVQFFVRQINEEIGIKKLQFVQNIFSENDLLTNSVLSGPQFYQCFLKYSDSLIEKALKCEFFPRKELDNFAYIMLSLPNNINVKNFELEKNYIIIELENNIKDDAEIFAYNLSLTEHFKEVLALENDAGEVYILCKR